MNVSTGTTRQPQSTQQPPTIGDSGSRGPINDDPLKQFVKELPSGLLDGSTSRTQPIAPRYATTHGTRTLAEFAALKERERRGQLGRDEAEYSRYGTPMTRRTESALAQVFEGETALVFRSGMAAIEKTLEAVLADGGHIVVFAQGYRQTNALLERWAKRGQIKLTSIPIDGFKNIGEHLNPTTKAVFFETPSNPFLRVIDVHSVKNQIKATGSDALLIVDDTFAPPPNQRSIESGADIVVPSLTKYIVGNNEVLAGAVIGSERHLQPILQLRSQCGNIAHDVDCEQILAGLETLSDRLLKANQNGEHVANILAHNPQVKQLFYPGHASHPDYNIAISQMSGFGGVVSFRIAASDLYDVAAFTDAFVESAPVGTFIAPSFGGNLPLISPVTVVSHFQQSADERRARGIPLDLIRLSCGTIPSEHLTIALRAGFEALGRRHDVSG